MAKCTENCPKCGAVRTQFEGQTSWNCGSFSMYVPGLNPFWAIAESEHCQARQQLAAANAEVERLRSLLAEAHEAVSNWGVYAGDYFQEKWGWQQDVEKFAPFAQYYPKDHPHDE